MDYPLVLHYYKTYAAILTRLSDSLFVVTVVDDDTGEMSRRTYWSKDDLMKDWEFYED